ncbi:MAG: tetratricopeptide repeat protein [Bacteroidales bacterium]|nr:tetratricopeptide repeat protein [Bacteroidales bacterium]
MAKENLKKEEERLESIETTLDSAELFIEKNRKTIVIVVSILVILVLAIFGYKKLVQEPREERAQAAVFRAEAMFEKDDFATALNGNGNDVVGFLDIINEYSGTKTANLAKYYAGICYLNTGDFNNAIKYLGEFKGKDKMVKPLAIGAMGDANLELGNVAEAAKCYENAANASKNSFTSPMMLVKAAYTYEMAGNYAKAVEMYKAIKADYPNSTEARDIDKYITAAETKLGNN